MRSKVYDIRYVYKHIHHEQQQAIVLADTELDAATTLHSKYKVGIASVITITSCTELHDGAVVFVTDKAKK